MAIESGKYFTSNESAPSIGTVVATGIRDEDGREEGYTPTGVGSPIVTEAVQATGTELASGNPADGSSLPNLNGVSTIVFKDSPGAFPEVQRETTRALTLATLASQLNLAVALNPSLYPTLVGYTYSSDATHLIVTAKVAGTGGNAFTFGTDAGVWTRSAATLTGGAAATFDPAGSGTNPLNVALDGGDIEIGAVEIKNATDDTRAVVKSDGTNNALVVTQNAVPLATGSATSANQATQITAEQAIQATLGATSGAAVVTDANGTLQQYLRGIVKLLITTGTIILGAGSAIIGKVGIDQTTPGITNGVQVNAALPVGTNSIGAVTNIPLTNIGAGEYETVAASQTAQVLGGAGAIGDWLAGLLIIPATVDAGNVLLLDNATSITIFAGGTGSVSNLVPFFVPLGMKSVSGAFKVTTGANVSVIGIGNFS